MPNSISICTYGERERERERGRNKDGKEDFQFLYAYFCLCNQKEAFAVFKSSNWLTIQDFVNYPNGALTKGSDLHIVIKKMRMGGVISEITRQVHVIVKKTQCNLP